MTLIGNPTLARMLALNCSTLSRAGSLRVFGYLPFYSRCLFAIVCSLIASVSKHNFFRTVQQFGVLYDASYIGRSAVDCIYHFRIRVHDYVSLHSKAPLVVLMELSVALTTALKCGCMRWYLRQTLDAGLSRPY